MAAWRVQIGITFPDVFGLYKGERLKDKGKRHGAQGERHTAGMFGIIVSFRWEVIIHLCYNFPATGPTSQLLPAITKPHVHISRE